jgi:hypothetical protein
MYDSAVSQQMGFSATGSGTGENQPQVALVQTFMYSNAIFGSPSNASVLDPSLVAMVNANLDARLPVGVALNGHEVVCDGYGYDLSTLYHHLNMGWGGTGNAWYTFPNVGSFTNLWGFIYNIYTNGSGEIISGRVTSNNLPVTNATVTASRGGGGTYTAQTDTNGIYALAGVPSHSPYSLVVTAPKYRSAGTNVVTGMSSDSSPTTGNVWGANFYLVAGSGPPLITAQPQSQLFCDLGASVSFSVSVFGPGPITYQWLFNGATVPGASGPSLTLPGVQPINAGQYSVVVTGPAGSVTSAGATLAMATPPTAGARPAGKPGFIARCAQIDYPGADANAVMNSLTNLESALGPVSTNNTDTAGAPSAGLMSDPHTGLDCVNVANLLTADANGFFFVPGYLNMDIAGPTAQDGDFTSRDGVSGWPKSPFPGIPGFSQNCPNTSEFGVAFTAFVYLQAGVTQFGVNSDDGFLLTIASGLNPNDAFSRVPVGQYSGGRSAGDTLMNLTVPTNGAYALRLDYEQGSGGASCELFTVANGVKILVNDTNNPKSLMAYPTPEVYAEPYAVLVSPAPGQTGVVPGSQITVLLQDGVPAAVKTNSILLRLNGAAVAPSVSQAPSALPNGKPLGNLTRIACFCSVGSYVSGTNTAELSFADSRGNLIDRTWNFTCNPILSPVNANPPGSANPANLGFIVYPWSTSSNEPNDVAVWTEEQILGLMGTNCARLANWPNSQNQKAESALPGPQGSCFVYTGSINWDIQGPAADNGDFTSPKWPKQEFPGIISGSYPDESGLPAGNVNNFSMLVETWLDFPAAGTWQMGVNSDDGFSVKSGQAPGDVFGQTVGEYEGGRSASDTIFPFFVPQPGLYPFRLLYEQGSGGANCEWFTLGSAGQRVLINDSSQGTNSIPAYVTAGNSPICVSGVVPVNGQSGVPTNAAITAWVADGSPAKVASVQMWINGSGAAVGTSRKGSVTSATANTNGPTLLLPGTNNTVRIVYTDNSSPPRHYTNSWQFSVRPAVGGNVVPLYSPPPMDLSSETANIAMATAAPGPPVVSRGPLLSLLVLDGQLQLTLRGEVGHTYRIESSTDLRTWADVLTMAPSFEITTVNLSSTNKVLFYRAVSP